MTVGTEAKNAVACPRCGADKGDVCISSTGGVVTNSHKARVELYNTSQRPIPEFIAVTDGLLSEIAEHRENRIQAVLFGIGLARNLMKVPQERLDRNLAEMIVDAELDLKLF